MHWHSLYRVRATAIIRIETGFIMTETKEEQEKEDWLSSYHLWLVIRTAVLDRRNQVQDHVQDLPVPPLSLGNILVWVARAGLLTTTHLHYTFATLLSVITFCYLCFLLSNVLWKLFIVTFFRNNFYNWNRTTYMLESQKFESTMT